MYLLQIAASDTVLYDRKGRCRRSQTFSNFFFPFAFETFPNGNENFTTTKMKLKISVSIY